jgi:hypothetical protein
VGNGLGSRGRELPALIHQCARSTASTVVIPAIIEPAIAIAAGARAEQTPFRSTDRPGLVEICARLLRSW